MRTVEEEWGMAFNGVVAPPGFGDWVKIANLPGSTSPPLFAYSFAGMTADVETECLKVVVYWLAL